MNINMKSLKKSAARGFTLIELMIVVAIIGILAVIAVVGVRRYLASAKSAEARQTLGAISRSSVQAYEGEKAASEILAAGAESAVASRTLCASATDPVPKAATPPAGKKYQPSNSAGLDFSAGTQTAGWKCLKFSMDQPVLYQYTYKAGSGYVAVAEGGADPGAGGFEAAAKGDLDADGTSFSYFSVGGTVDATTKELRTTTTMFEKDVEE